MRELSTEGRSMCQANYKCYVASRVGMMKLMKQNVKEIGRNVFEGTILALAHYGLLSHKKYPNTVCGSG